MNEMMKQPRNRIRPLGWGAAAALLLAPLVAMKFAPSSGVYWTGSDFVLAGIMIGTVGLLIELAVRASSHRSFRLAALIAVGTGFLLIWSNLAVGYIGDGDAPINIAFLAIPPLALVAGVVAGFRSGAMAMIMTAAAVAHAIAGAIGFPQDPRTGPITAVFTGLWLASAWAFRRAARQGAR